MIKQPSRRSDHDINAALEIVLLLSVADTAVYDRYLQVGKTPIVAKCGLDLGRELARRFQHETAKVSVMREQGEYRKRKCRGFSGAGLRRAD